MVSLDKKHQQNSSKLCKAYHYMHAFAIQYQLSEEFGCNVYLKREDLQAVRSYKIRGAYNKVVPCRAKTKGVVCAGAGNHARRKLFLFLS